MDASFYCLGHHSPRPQGGAIHGLTAFSFCGMNMSLVGCCGEIQILFSPTGNKGEFGKSHPVADRVNPEGECTGIALLFQ